MQFQSPSLVQTPLRPPPVGEIEGTLGVDVPTGMTDIGGGTEYEEKLVDALVGKLADKLDDNWTAGGSLAVAVEELSELPEPPEPPTTTVPVKVGVAAGYVPVAVIPAPPVHAGAPED